MYQQSDANTVSSHDSLFLEESKAGVLRGIAYIGIVGLFGFHLICIVVGADIGDYLMSSMAYLVFGGILYAVNTKRISLAKDIACYFGLFNAIGNHYLYGSETGLEMIYLVVLLAATYLYSSKKSLIFTIVGICFYLTIQFYLIQTGTTSGILSLPSHTKTFTFLVTIAVIILFFKNILKEDELFHKMNNKQNEKLQYSNEQLRRFNFVLVNDLKKPIKKLIADSTSLTSNQNLDPQLEKLKIETIINDGKKLSEIVKSIKSFQDLKDSDFEFEDLKLTDIIKDANKNLTQLLKSNRATVSYGDNVNIVSSKYQLFTAIKSILEHIISEKHDKCMNIHFSFDDSNKDMISMYIDTISYTHNFKVVKTVNKKKFAPLIENNSKEKLTDLIVIQKMIHQIGGEVYMTVNEDEKAYLIKLPKKK